MIPAVASAVAMQIQKLSPGRKVWFQRQHKALGGGGGGRQAQALGAETAA